MATVDSRRGLLRRAIFGIAGLSLVGVAAACGDKEGEPAAREVTVSRADVPTVDGDPYRSETGRFYLVHNSDGVLAFSWRCTHQGCEVPWREEEQRFFCPCHASTFDRNGVRLGGPARRPLDLVQVEVLSNGDIAVAARELTERSDYEADQAVPYPASDPGSG